jgi:hypothetical protein
MLSRRVPSFVSNNSPVGSARASDHLFGNVEAYDLLKGLATGGKELHAVFAASGDLRNVIRTVNSLPEGAPPLHIRVNDFNPRVALRNYLLLRLLFERGEEAVDAVIGLWYSMAVTYSQRNACLSTFS